MNAKNHRTPSARAGSAWFALGVAGALVLLAQIPGHAQTETPAAPPSDRHGFLGVSLDDLGSRTRDRLDYSGPGAVVTEVTSGSPAAKLGIRRGDVITRFEDRPVNDADQLTDMVRAMSPGSLAGVWVWRDGKETFLGRTELGDRRDPWYPDSWATPRAPAAPRAPRAPRAPHAVHDHDHDDDDGIHVYRLGRGRLGVETHDLDSELGSYFQAPNGKGVLVLRVVDDSPARKAGVKAGDVIVAVGGKNVDSSSDLRRELREHGKGPVDLRILRKGTAQTLKPDLDDRSGFDYRNDGGDWLGWAGDLEGLRGLTMLDEVPGLERLGELDFDFDFDQLDDLDNFGDDDDDHVFRWNWNGGPNGTRVYRWEDLDPEDKARLKKELDELRDDMQELKRETKSRVREIKAD